MISFIKGGIKIRTSYQIYKWVSDVSVTDQKMSTSVFSTAHSETGTHVGEHKKASSVFVCSLSGTVRMCWMALRVWLASLIHSDSLRAESSWELAPLTWWEFFFANIFLLLDPMILWRFIEFFFIISFRCCLSSLREFWGCWSSSDFPGTESALQSSV